MNNKIISLNIYHLNPIANKFFGQLGLGLYHTGIVIKNIEYSFGSNGNNEGGIFAIIPGTYNKYWKRTIIIGEIDLTDYDIDCILNSFRNQFLEDEYNIIYNNCNDFTKIFGKELCNYKQPKWINRAARVGRKLCCCCKCKKKPLVYQPCYDSCSDYDSIIIDAYSCSNKMN